MGACGRRAEHCWQQYAWVDVLVHPPNPIGMLVGPLMLSNGFHGGDPIRRGFGQPAASEDLERCGEFASCQGGAEK
jgi:hypothetical protein